MIKLSYTTITDIHTGGSHTWLNKQSGIEKPGKDYFETGKKLHRMIQDHYMGLGTLSKEFPERITDLIFDVVEKKDFDPECHVERKLAPGYVLHGYVDGLNTFEQSILEIKSGVSLWSHGQYLKSMQRKVYAYCLPEYKKSYLITLHSDQRKWGNFPAKLFEVEATDKDRERARDWALAAVKLIQDGDLKGGLVDEKCQGCSYGRNCLFRGEYD